MLIPAGKDDPILMKYLDTFTIRRESSGLQTSFAISDGAETVRFTREQLLSWIRNALDDDLGIYREDGAAVTAEFVECTIRMRAI